MSYTILILYFFLNLATSDQSIHGGFMFDGYFKLAETRTAEMNNSNMSSHVIYTDGGLSEASQVYYKVPFQFKNSTTSPVISFSTTFIFAVVTKDPEFSGHGLAFAISPSDGIPEAFPNQYLGLFNATNNGKGSNHIVAVELDTDQDFQFDDIDNNHLGIDINGLVSIKSASAGYYTNDRGRFRELDIKSGTAMQVWVEYNSKHQQFNVTIHPISIPKPELPLLSLTRDLSPYFFEFMHVGFSSASGSKSSHYILGWSFKINGQADEINLSHLPDIPGITVGKGDDDDDDDDDGGYSKLQKMLVVILSLVGGMFLLILIFGALMISRRRKFIQVLEDWEVLYGPYRFTYKDLFIATKGFRDKELLGKGGFGRVYRGTLAFSNVQIAVKRISHDSSQGMREFIAEIATIGRLRHPNLVRLLGYCRRRNELFLIYDYMPNGSLDKFLYRLPNSTLNWKQRFKIIKDVASALFYLHQQWVQVIIHRDIKPGNVLIDHDMNARLGDFGLAKLCDHGNDPQTSHVAGTPGYIDPEIVQSGKSNTCTDIYAFGVFMLEVACGRKPVEPRTSPDKVMLIEWVMNCWEKGAILETADFRLGNEYVIHEVELVLKLGLLCSHPVAAARPTMSSVVQLLDGAARLPDNLFAIIRARDSGDRSSQVGVTRDFLSDKISVSSITFTESFISDGR
ncbi:L-type lectin-domain containing receptor kinase V.9 [Ricinus communis]|uniref:non-specific serine/threonine protein kinase n=1 Tax=Ricinus communis TaxID=3988 RepID=B9SZX6_RICCO|nr:L-type lectin-domain containing receptor kinase V.9 [Ricinus communis]EEF30839.1 carbohydrate binding protein, putative [Ricinus communis]|eukprot:XP_025015284.1 L-type lectin-domain containing receptor kinase V.9 [Ricinus communis]